MEKQPKKSKLSKGSNLPKLDENEKLNSIEKLKLPQKKLLGNYYDLHKKNVQIKNHYANQKVKLLTTSLNSFKKALEYQNNEPFKNYIDNVSSINKELKKELKKAKKNLFYLDAIDENKTHKDDINTLKLKIELDKEKIKFANSIIENQSSFDAKRAKEKTTKNNTFSLKPNFIDKEWQIKIIQEKSQSIFNSTLEQWQNIFSEDIAPLKTPIELNNGVTLATLREFIKGLTDYRLIATRGALKTLADVNAFSFDNSIVTAKQLSDATSTINTNFYTQNDKVKEIFKALKLD